MNTHSEETLFERAPFSRREEALERWTLPNGEGVYLRFGHPDDEAGILEYIDTLSDADVHARYMGQRKSRIHTITTQHPYNDADNHTEHLVLLVCRDVDDRIIAVAQAKHGSEGIFDIAFSRSSAYAQEHLGTPLVDALLRVAKEIPEIQGLHADMWGDNRNMVHMLGDRGFSLAPQEGDATVTTANLLIPREKQDQELPQEIPA